MKLAEAFISALYSMYKIRYLYPPPHPKFAESLQPARQFLEKLLLAGKEVTIIIVEREFIYEGQPLFRTFPAMQDFVDVFEQLEIERFIFLRGIMPEEIAAFVSLLTARPDEIKAQGGIEAARKKQGISHVILERLILPTALENIVTDHALEEETYGVLPPTIRGQYGELYENTRNIFTELAKSGGGGDLAILTKQLNHTVDEIYDSIEDFVEAFNTTEATFGEYDHEVNVCALTLAFGKRLGLDLPYLKNLALAALLHDFGKQSLPLDLQNKPAGLLSPGEMELYREHPLHGAERLLAVKDVRPLTVIVAYEHHTGFDRKGFPKLPDDQTPHPASLIVALVDRYENLARLSPERLKPRNYIARMQPFRGAEFEPHLFDVFMSLLLEQTSIAHNRA